MNERDDLALLMTFPCLREVLETPDIHNEDTDQTTSFRGGGRLTLSDLTGIRHSECDDSGGIFKCWDIDYYYAIGRDGTLDADFVRSGETLAAALARHPVRPAKVVHVSRNTGAAGPGSQVFEDSTWVTCYTIDGHEGLDDLIAEAMKLVAERTARTR